ncbi:MAG: hypothetical protein GQ547_07455 [Methylophaga sp.]|nr:hypothetical protein [Methylophaga sp.]
MFHIKFPININSSITYKVFSIKLSYTLTPLILAHNHPSGDPEPSQTFNLSYC